MPSVFVLFLVPAERFHLELPVSSLRFVGDLWNQKLSK